MLIIPYQESWQDDFNKIKEVLWARLNTSNVQIEHVGSTSVVGMAAKAIIDIDVVYSIDIDLLEVSSELEILGYYHNGNQGIAGREVFKRAAGSDHKVLDNISHHLYVCHESSPELKRHLLFKQYLQQNEEARNHYKEIKLALASKANQNKKSYALLKEKEASIFINECIRKQEIENGK